MLSTCRYCQGEIVWAKRDSGGWYPPFEQIEPLGIEVGTDQVLLVPAGGAYVKVSAVDGMVLARFHECSKRPVPTQRHDLFRGTTAPDPVKPREFWERYPNYVWARYWNTPTKLQMMQVPCPRCDAAVGGPCVSVMQSHRTFLQQPHLERRKAVREWAMTHVEAASDADLKSTDKVHQLKKFFRGAGKELFGVDQSPRDELEPSVVPEAPLGDAVVNQNQNAGLSVPKGVESDGTEPTAEGVEWWSSLVAT